MRIISIKKLQREFTKQFPESPLTAILLQEKEELTPEELFAKISTWLAILNTDKRR
ncbi:MAG: hypothetical protein RXP30_01265 [Thermoplasmata archaeon]|nr:hypothetical protein [Euryarchaeota archaeon]